MTLTKEAILQRADSYDIFTHYLEPFSNGKRLRSGNLIKSPLREEKHPSFNIYLPKGASHRDGWRFKDFAGEGGDCFAFVMQFFHLTFPEALQKIAADFHLDNLQSEFHHSSPESKPKKEIVMGNNYSITVKDFSVKELDFWLQYGITQEELQKFNVVSLASYTTKNKDGKEYTFRSNETSFIFAYQHDGGVKLYKPHDKQFRFQHLGTKPENFIFGFDKLPEAGEILFLTGGEKDVLSLTAHGFNAISLNSETANLDSAVVNQLKLRFKNLIVLYDNDETGLKQSEKISKQHQFKRILLPSMENGKDISDFFQQFPLAQFQNLIDETLASSHRSVEQDKPYLLSAIELLAVDDSTDRYLVSPLIPACTTSVLVGKPDTGKSQLARQLCIHVSQGHSKFLDFDLTLKFKSALYVSTEDNQYNTKFLFRRQMEGLKAEPNENLHFIFADILSQDELISEIRDFLSKKPCDVVVVDSFGDIFKGSDMNSTTQMRANVKEFDRIAVQFQATILFIHHINKSAYTQAPAQQHVQGGGGLVQKVRCAIQLTPGEHDVKFLSVTKGNYCPREYKQNAVELKFDENNFIFTNTGNKIPLDQINPDPDKKDRDDKIQTLSNTAEVAFQKDKELSYKQLAKQLETITTKSFPTVKRMIKNLLDLGIIGKTETGKYFLVVTPNSTPDTPL